MGIDFMMAANQEKITTPLGNVVVIGGGFTAVDCTRMAYRLGAKKITLAYRRTKDSMYVSHHELDAMEAEGIELAFLVAPVSIETKDGKTTGITFIRHAIQPNHVVTTIENSEFVMAADTVIFAIGQQAEENLTPTPISRQQDNFFVTGDFRNGASTVIQAAADGRKTAREVHQFLFNGPEWVDVVHISPVTDTGRKRDYDFIPRQNMDVTPLFERQIKNKEVETGFSREKRMSKPNGVICAITISRLISIAVFIVWPAWMSCPWIVLKWSKILKSVPTVHCPMWMLENGAKCKQLPLITTNASAAATASAPVPWIVSPSPPSNWKPRRKNEQSIIHFVVYLR